MNPAEEPAGLYLHIPFCRSICPYCDFAVSVARPAARAALVEDLITEIVSYPDWKRPFDTVYFGGGTPSMLEPEALQRLLSAARSHLPVAGDARIYLEVNPEDANAERAAAWRTLGVGTVSLGVQSFVTSELRRLGRHHRPERARAAVECCLEAGFATVSADLIFGLHDQTAAQWVHSLKTLIALAPQHISCYQLTIHEGTTFGRWRARGKLIEMPETQQATHFALTHRLLAEAGWRAYEVSNFAAAPEHRSRHNRKYWRHVPYLGLGPSAHSFDGRSRWWNLRDAKAYGEALRAARRPRAGIERLSDADLALETVMLGLRTTEGIDLDAFRARFGIDLVERNRALVDELGERGYLRNAGTRLAPTVKGLAVADGLASRLRLAD